MFHQGAHWRNRSSKSVEMKRAVLLILLLLSSVSHVSAQSLPKAAVFILSGGFVDLQDIKEIDQDTVHIPRYLFAITFLVQPVILKIINRQQCVVSTSPDGYEAPQAVFYFNNVIVKETTDNPIGSNYSKLYLKGEDYVFCIIQQNNTKSCLRQWDTAIITDNVPRVYNARIQVASA
jgi:hypothetical protein